MGQPFCWLPHFLFLYGLLVKFEKFGHDFALYFLFFVAFALPKFCKAALCCSACVIRLFFILPKNVPIRGGTS